ncbi:hypothetical protein [Micromonospora sp. NPDC048063]|uniref:hypothetical protein n=1 Tax=Micromonospora sp. NPDC048063 TaxID=3364256 RepID=UPI00371797A7
MQPGGPYRLTHVLGGSPVGKAWAGIDEQGRFVTVAVLDASVAAAPGWREAFVGMANSLAQAADPLPYAYVDFSAAAPWVAYSAEVGPGAEKLFRALGVEYTPEPTDARPVSGMPQPVSGMPQSVSGVPRPVPGLEEPTQLFSTQSQAAGAAQPWSVSAPPVSGAPILPASTPSAAAPASAPPQAARDPFAATDRRIAPVRPQPKRRGRIWIAVGALALALVAGTAGYVLAASGDAAEPGAAPSSSTSLPPFEATQFSINKAKFEGELAPLAEPWLTRIGGCTADTEVGGPKLPADEKRHVFCRYGGASLHFAQYPAREQKDAARAYRQQLNLAGGALAPGLREATRTTGGVTGAPGSYVEYAFKGDDGRTICGIWWDRDDVEGAFYVETLCEAGIAGNWDAMRDLWRRNS